MKMFATSESRSQLHSHQVSSIIRPRYWKSIKPQSMYENQPKLPSTSNLAMWIYFSRDYSCTRRGTSPDFRTSASPHSIRVSSISTSDMWFACGTSGPELGLLIHAEGGFCVSHSDDLCVQWLNIMWKCNHPNVLKLLMYQCWDYAETMKRLKVLSFNEKYR